MTEDSNKSIRDYVEKLADDKLAEVMGEEPKKASWPSGKRWASDELEWESYKPRADVAQSQKEWRRKLSLFDDDEEVSGFRKTRRSSVAVDGPEDWAEVVRPEGGMVVLSDYMVTKMADIMMREMSDLLERAQLIYVSEAASQNVRKGMRKIIGEYVCFLDKRTGEYCDVETE